MLKLLTISLLFWFYATTISCMEYDVLESNQSGTTSINVTSSVINITKDLFANITTLENLEMRNVDVKTITENCFADLHNLRIVTLPKNQITFVPKNTFSNTKIYSINLSSNKINEIADGAFKDMTNLSWLDLSNNNIIKVNGNWFKDTAAELLDLSKNQIVRIHKDSFKGLKNLFYLDLSFNHIHLIQDGTFSHYTVLGFLDLRANALTNLNFLSNTYIEELHVALNKLTNLKLGPTTTIKEIGIYPNPLRCKDLVDFFKATRMRGMKIRSAKNSVVSWDNKYPVCVNDDASVQTGDKEERLNDLYFNSVDYTVIGKYKT